MKFRNDSHKFYTSSLWKFLFRFALELHKLQKRSKIVHKIYDFLFSFTRRSHELHSASRTDEQKLIVYWQLWCIHALHYDQPQLSSSLLQSSSRWCLEKVSHFLIWEESEKHPKMKSAQVDAESELERNFRHSIDSVYVHIWELWYILYFFSSSFCELWGLRQREN